jgi:hypothetical protein
MRPWVLVWVLACGGTSAPEPAAPAAVEAPPAAVEAPKSEPPQGPPEGVKHPPIPADNPAWSEDRGGFVPNHFFYGERSWADVRMRLAGHIGTIARDRARWFAARGAWNKAATLQRDAARQIGGLQTSASPRATLLRDLWRDAAERDAEWLTRVASGAVSATRESVPPTKFKQKLGDFADFDARHQLRVDLTRAYLAAVDPVQFSEPWGYWDGLPKPTAAFTLEGLAGMPTGDSLIDVAGEPGPAAIGKLARLGLDDAAHIAWINAQLPVLNDALVNDPPAVVRHLSEMVAALNRYSHGSRYYNIKQVRNAGVRQLARAGHPELARQVLVLNRPFHHQDWACPNRVGIVLAIEGRLLAVAGDPRAPEVLRRAAEATSGFLADVDQAAVLGH